MATSMETGIEPAASAGRGVGAVGSVARGVETGGWRRAAGDGKMRKPLRMVIYSGMHPEGSRFPPVASRLNSGRIPPKERHSARPEQQRPGHDAHDRA